MCFGSVVYSGEVSGPDWLMIEAEGQREGEYFLGLRVR